MGPLTTQQLSPHSPHPIYINNIGTQEQVAVHIWSFNGGWRGNYFGGEPIRRTEVELRVGKLRMEKLQVRMMSRER